MDVKKYMKTAVLEIINDFNLVHPKLKPISTFKESAYLILKHLILGTL